MSSLSRSDPTQEECPHPLTSLSYAKVSLCGNDVTREEISPCHKSPIANRAIIDIARSTSPPGFAGDARRCRPKRRTPRSAPSGPVAQSGQSIGLLIRVSWVRIPAGLPLPLYPKRPRALVVEYQSTRLVVGVRAVCNQQVMDILRKFAVARRPVQPHWSSAPPILEVNIRSPL